VSAKAFRTKERKTAVFTAIVAVVLTVVFLIWNYSENRKSTMQAVMAENYLKAGNYEQAVDAYQKALLIKNSDRQILTIGLSKAYAGLEDYDNALQILRSYYQKTHGTQVKEMIEKVSSEKTDYEYNQAAARAEVYFDNEEYDKAIAEYQKAKLIKSKEATSFKRIAQAYLKKGKYELAKEELLEGLELTKDDSLTRILDRVDALLTKEQYDEMIKQASEFVNQENYSEGTGKYERAIILLPKESKAYQKLAEVYIAQKEYEKAASLLRNAVKLTDQKELKNLLAETVRLKNARVKRNSILCGISNALADRDFIVAAAMLNLAYKDKSIEKELPISYIPETGNTAGGRTMVIDKGGKVYLGSLKNGKKSGSGILFLPTADALELEYYCYDGEWKNDIPNGKGKAEEITVYLDGNGLKSLRKTITEGSFRKAYENGNMTKYFYINNIETGRVKYTAKNGKPQPIYEGSNPEKKAENGAYAIGAISVGEIPSDKYYYAEPEAIWGIKTYNSKE
jgi:tetratricopeptide (TPR) repeat protein